MASPRDQNASGDGVVIVPPTYYRPTGEVGLPGNGSHTQGTQRTAVRNVNEMASTRGTLIHNGGHVSGTQRGPAQNRIRTTGTRRQPAFNQTPGRPVYDGNQLQDSRDPEQLRSIPEQEYPTMADRLLALRANRRTANCQPSSAAHPVTSVVGDNNVVTSRQGGTPPRQVIMTSHGDQQTNGTIRRSEKSKFVIKIFTTVACLVGLLLMIISIAFLTRSTASNVL